jgi:hypothetical protein
MATSQCATPPRPACRGPVCWSKMAKIVSFTGCQPFRNGEKDTLA